MKLKKPINEGKVELYECYTNEPPTSMLSDYAKYANPNPNSITFMCDGMAEGAANAIGSYVTAMVTSPLVWYALYY